ncbi:citrate synthase [Niallia sp. NCCP-28]|uniref:citrate synthase n=1 Tax=Niallia sp. NCCP-28 TaxID=2934712 RepID=UPI00208276AB|nr:citrate synthase [Niallia sp. NCCP-28]GKU81544.1 citrate synthase 2 [Niallia sp. NCCP-28]
MAVTRGLEGIIATTSSISSIIDDSLAYVGYDIDALAENSSFEEIIYLLWNRRLPTSQELIQLQQELAENAELPESLINQLRMMPLDQVHPMSALRSAVSLLGVYDENAELMDEKSNYLKAINLQAKLPTIVTAFSRLRKGLEPVSPRKDLSFAANFLYMLTAKEPEPIAIEAFNKALVLHADHELNASTFTARVCVATLSDIYSGVTSAIGALKGPLHGGANEAVMKMLTEIGNEDNVDSYIKDKMVKKEKIMGFGHRVYRKGDPRAKHLKQMAKKLTELTGESHLFDMSIKIESMLKQEKNLVPNVDFFSASVYHSLGIDHDLFTPIFAVSRVSGWIAHILEQYENNRLIRPRADYVGPERLSYVPMQER